MISYKRTTEMLLPARKAGPLCLLLRGLFHKHGEGLGWARTSNSQCRREELQPFFPEPHSHRQGKGTNIYSKHLPGLGKGGITSKGENSDTAEPQLDVSALSPVSANAMVSNGSTSSVLHTLCQRWHRSRSQSLVFNKERALLLPNSHLGPGGMASKLDFGS